MKKSYSRSRKRQDERKQIIYDMRHASSLTKLSMPYETLTQLIHSISINRIADFGLKNIHQYDLDVEFVLSNVPGISEVKGTNIELYSLSTATLLSYAAYLNRDQIIAALLRAGANPSLMEFTDLRVSTARRLDPENTNHLHPSSAIHHRKVLEFFQSSEINSCFGTWIVKYYYGMAFQLGMDSKASNQCDLCHSLIECLAQHPCSHSICPSCFWKYLINDQPKRNDILCMACQTTLTANPNWSFVTLMSPETGISDDNLSTLKENSYEKWMQLPIELSEIVEKRPMFMAMPYSQQVKYYLGITQSQRINEAFKAVAHNDLLRLKALVNAGVDIDAQNEYGQTALFLACWKGFDKIAEYLISIRADQNISDNLQNLPIAASKVSRNLKILRLFNVIELEDIAGTRIVPATQDSHLDHIPLVSLQSITGWNLSFTIDGYLDDEYMSYLTSISELLPIAPREKECSSDRAYLCDIDTTMTAPLEAAINYAVMNIDPEYGNDKEFIVKVFPQMKFLIYREPKGSLAPHVDLSKNCEDFPNYSALHSTHTLILYLTDCEIGGNTTLLNSVKKECFGDNVIRTVQPKRGRLLVFPHLCPHAGAPVESVPKILLRGEVYIQEI